MKFISIVPTEYLTQYDYWASNTTLVLYHLLKSNPIYLHTCKLCNKNKILDNSFYELRKNPELRDLIEMGKAIKASTICLPDMPYSDYLNMYITGAAKKLKQAGFKTMATVTCSNDFETEMKIFRELNSIKDVDIISIPYVFRKEDDMMRWKFLDMIEKEIGIENVKKEIHLFGCNSIYNIPKENRKWVASIDGTLPFKEGYFKQKLPVKPEQEHKRPQDYFDISYLDEEQIECVKHNIKVIKEFCNMRVSNV